MLHQDFSIIAHRGFSSKAPENTLSAIEKALQLGVDMIEIDVHLTSDNQIVVIHDDTLDRTTNGRGKVVSKNLAYLKQLDAGSWFHHSFNSEKIPTLDEVLSLVDGKAVVLIEMKGDTNIYPELPVLLAKKLIDAQAFDWCIAQAFEIKLIDKLYRFAPTISCFYLIENEAIHFNQQNYFYKAINPNFDLLDDELVNNLHDNGLKTFPYTVNKKEDMLKLINFNVDGIITDYPDILKKTLNELSN